MGFSMRAGGVDKASLVRRSRSDDDAERVRKAVGPWDFGPIRVRKMTFRPRIALNRFATRRILQLWARSKPCGAPILDLAWPKWPTGVNIPMMWSAPMSALDSKRPESCR